VYLTTEETAQTIQELVIAIGENLSNKSRLNSPHAATGRIYGGATTVSTLEGRGVGVGRGSTVGGVWRGLAPPQKI